MASVWGVCLFFVLVFCLFSVVACFLLLFFVFCCCFFVCFLLFFLFFFCGGGGGIVFSLFLYHFTILTLWGCFVVVSGFFNIMAALCLRIVSK